MTTATKIPELPDGGVDLRTLVARQIRQYIETAPVFHVLAVGVGVGVTAGLVSGADHAAGR